jgi:hypothetical protein
MLGLFGAMVISGSFTGRYRLPGVSGWSNLLEGPLWIGMGSAVWRSDRTLLRRSLSLLLMVMGASVVGFMVWGSSPGFSLFMLGKMVVWLGLGVGMWSAREWARRGCVILGLLFYGYRLSSMAFAYDLFHERVSFGLVTWAMTITMTLFVIVGPPLALAIYAVLPSTRKHFAETREAMARTGAVQS